MSEDAGGLHEAVRTPGGPAAEGEAGPVRSRLEADRRDLLDLSLRNPLLNYRPRVRGLEFVGESPRELYRLLVVEGRSLSFAPAADRPAAAEERGGVAGMAPSEAEAPGGDGAAPVSHADGRLQTGLPADELAERLLAIHRAARTAVEEQGVNTLSLALGMLAWSDGPAGARLLLAPLLLVPVALWRTGARELFRLKHDGEDPGINLSLSEKLRAEFGVALPEPPEDDEPDVAAYFDAVAEAVRDRPGWGVRRDSAVLGFFSFGKFLMYRDLDPSSWPEGEGPDAHPIVARLLGDGFDGPAADPDEDDGRADRAGDLSLVLDADGSQSMALRDAADGATLVIQGPPGTGKSQTITNLIAGAIGRGGTVLFVAEKLAALEVVKRRLDALGLGEACLELHSQKTGKRAVLDQLRRTLGRARPGPVPACDLARRDELAGRLDAYCDAANAPIGESGVSPHEAIGTLLALRREAGGLPAIDLPGAGEWSAAEYRRRLELVERLQARLGGLGPLREHPFFGCRLAAFVPGEEAALRGRLATAGHAATGLRESAAALAGALGLPEASNRSACARLVEAARRAGDLARWDVTASAVAWQARREEVRELIEAGSALAAIRARYATTLMPEAWDADVSGPRRTLNAYGRRWGRWLVKSYREAVASLASLCRGEPPSRLDDRLALLDAILDARRLREVVLRHEPLGAALFGRRWRGDESDWPRLAEVAQGMYRLHVDVAEGRLPGGLLDAAADAPRHPGLEALARAVEAGMSAHREAIQDVLGYLDLDEGARFGAEGGLAEVAFDRQGRQLEEWSGRVGTLAGLAAFNEAAACCRAEGMGAVAALAVEWDAAGARLATAFLKARLEALLRRAGRERPALAGFDGASHERLIDEFRTLDQAALARARAEIARGHWARLPRHAGGGQLATLRREMAKKARHLPVRQLIARSGNAIQAIAPVFLMSPLSVAAYLPPGAIRFDLVVFDEASQVRPVEALGALLRGKQAVVVGDGRQLPPTSFFDRLVGGDDAGDDEESSADVESILGLFAAQGAPERMLRWHYRSRHESLIAVSNREFYDGRLVVFPSPDASRRDSGLVLRHLPETAYDRGRTRTNRGEADAVARAVMEFAREQLRRPAGARRSLGVATFSVAQMQAVVDRVERLRRDEPACEEFFAEGADEPFFIKNLENVQGDERDAIFISVGYGRAADGSLTMNFGPLNGEGGERRLNVLITRARERCEVFTNLRADDLDPSRSRGRGPAALRTFLAFAEGEVAAVPVAGAPTAAASPFLEAIRAEIDRDGPPTRAGIGDAGCRVDLAVCDADGSGRYVLGVGSDGPSYREARAARDRDRLRPQVLERLGWRLHRAWSPDWLRDGGAASARLRAAVADAIAPMAEAATPPETAPTRPDRGAVESGEAHEPPPVEGGAPAVAMYRVAELPGLGPGADLAAMPPADLARHVAEVVRVEGPVHVAEVARRIADAAGVRRLGPRVQESIESACARAAELGEVRRAGEFLWPAAMERPTARDRSGLPAASRRLEWLAPEELAVAIERVAREAFGIDPASLPAAVCRLLGIARAGDDWRRGIEAGAEELIASGRLTRRGGYLVAAADPPAV